MRDPARNFRGDTRLSCAGLRCAERTGLARAGTRGFFTGLKIAEMFTPARHESLGSTFGGFLRVAIGVNALLYFSIFALAGYLVERRLSR
jgi:hypothetical protein